MKKFFILLVTCILLLAGSQYNSKRSHSLDANTYRDSDIIYESESGKSYSIDALPYDMVYNDITIKLLSSEYYQSKTDHGYNIYVVLNLDISDLSDDDLYWIEKDEALASRVYLDKGKNNINFDGMSELCYLDVKGVRKIAFWNHEEYRYDFEATEATISIDIDQNETYKYKSDEGKTTLLNKTYTYFFNYTIEGTDIKSESDIDSTLYNKMIKSFDNLKDIYNNLF